MELVHRVESRLVRHPVPDPDQHPSRHCQCQYPHPHPMLPPGMGENFEYEASEIHLGMLLSQNLKSIVPSFWPVPEPVAELVEAPGPSTPHSGLDPESPLSFRPSASEWRNILYPPSHPTHTKTYHSIITSCNSL